jgi:hypothetical protein
MIDNNGFGVENRLYSGCQARIDVTCDRVRSIQLSRCDCYIQVVKDVLMSHMIAVARANCHDVTATDRYLFFLQGMKFDFVGIIRGISPCASHALRTETIPVLS